MEKILLYAEDISKTFGKETDMVPILDHVTVVIIVLGHRISSSIEADYVNMGILKTVGFTGKKLRRIQMVQYLTAILGGMFGGLVLSVFFSRFMGSVTLTTTGIRIPAELPLVWCFLSFASVLLILTGFIALKTGKISSITPMKAIRGEISTKQSRKNGWLPILGNHLKASLALRQITAGKRRYAGACIVAVLLVFFASYDWPYGFLAWNRWSGNDGGI